MAWSFTDASGQEKLISTSAYESGPVGSGVLWFSDTPPVGYLLCQGQSLNRADYPELFAVLGVQYGSSSATTFNLPNLVGRVPVGKDASQVEFDVLGENGGVKTVTLTANQSGLRGHTHTHAFYHSGAEAGGYNLSASGGFLDRPLVTAGSGQSGRIDSVAASNALESHTNLQPYTVVHYAIKYTSASPAPGLGVIPYNAPGKEIAVVASTSNVSTGALASGTFSGAFLTMNLTGDGATPIIIDVSGFGPYISAGSAGHFQFSLHDGAIASASIFHAQQFYCPSVGVSGGGMRMEGRLAPFTGTKTINLSCFVNQASTVINQANANQQTRMTARWGG